MNDYNIIISGAGIVGMSLALTLSKLDMRIALIEQSNLADKKFTSYPNMMTATSYSIYTDLIQPIVDFNDIGVMNKIIIKADNHVLNLNPENSDYLPMGFVLNNNEIKQKFLAKIREDRNITLIDNLQYTKITNTRDYVEIESSFKKITAELLVVTEGKWSDIANFIPIPKKIEKNYNQACISAVIEHQNEHNNVATDYLLKTGPLATIPLYDSYHSSVIWLIDKCSIEYSYINDIQTLEKQITKHTGIAGVKILSMDTIDSITLSFAKDVFFQRCLLIGDSLMSIHPIAGQGLNAAWNNIKIFNEIATNYMRYAVDIGSEEFLKKFKQSIYLENIYMILLTDSLNGSFTSPIFRKMASKVLSMTNKVECIKNIIVHEAMFRDGLKKFKIPNFFFN